MSALMILARQQLGGVLGIVGKGARSAPFGLGAGLGGIAGSVGIPGMTLFGDEKRHRHRRRKMFTDTDLAQFAAAEAIGGKKTASALMMIRAAKA